MKYFIYPLLLIASHLFSVDDSPACFRRLQQDFFNEKIVTEALSLSSVPQNTWNMIILNLNKKKRELPTMISARARAMSRNPLSRPFDHEAAFTLLHQEAKRIYTDALLQNGVTNMSVIEQTFDYIYKTDSARISLCFEQASSLAH
ncbi:MAG: hypothetical protein WD595_05270 [Waddliaceae bacterium]